jgi:hypothetical protein
VANEVREFIREFGKVPNELKRLLRPELRIIGNEVKAEAQSNAWWSTRIPAATRVAVGFSTRNPGVSIVVNKNKAPEARPLEHGGNSGTFRHMVFGHKDRWVSQPARPFLAPAAAAKGDSAAERVGDLFIRVTREAGFR